MGKLSDDQAKQLKELEALRDAPDEDSDFEIEIGSEGNYARVPYRKGRSWLQRTFGIDLDPEPAGDEGEGEPKKAKAAPKDAPGEGGTVRFGRRVS